MGKRKLKNKIKELKHQCNFWRNNNQGNYDRWKEANYERLDLLKKLKELQPNTHVNQ